MLTLRGISGIMELQSEFVYQLQLPALAPNTANSSLRYRTDPAPQHANAFTPN